jgi:5'(3')-deoxyribonucleotidase
MKIYLDIDGVLADFVSGAFKAFGREDMTWPPNASDISEVLGVSMKDFYKRLEDLGEDFWFNLEKYPWSDRLVAELQKIGDVYLVTSPTLDPHCASGKMMWIRKHYPALYADKVILMRSKEMLKAKGNVLIDDSVANCTAFIKVGGWAMMFKQPWNIAGFDSSFDRVEDTISALHRVIEFMQDKSNCTTPVQIA